jgi:hypothetical protein
VALRRDEITMPEAGESDDGGRLLLRVTEQIDALWTALTDPYKASGRPSTYCQLPASDGTGSRKSLFPIFLDSERLNYENSRIELLQAFGSQKIQTLRINSRLFPFLLP